MTSVDEICIDLPSVGRTFGHDRHVRIGDVTPSGRARFDALARYAQDVSSDDTDDAGFGGPSSETVWVVSRLRLRVAGFPRHREQLQLTTWCSGLGRAWAERWVRMVGSDGARVDAAALWIPTDRTSGRPRRLSPEFIAAYGEAAMGRELRANRRYSAVPEESDGSEWSVRRSDLDRLNHVNNAASWEALEESLPADLAAPVVGEAEYLLSTTADDTLRRHVRGEGAAQQVWLAGPTGKTHTCFVVQPLTSPTPAVDA